MSAVDPEAYEALQRRMFKLLDALLYVNSKVLERQDPHVAAVVFTVLGRLYTEDMASVVDHPDAQRWIADLYAESRKQTRTVAESEDH